MTLRRLTPHDMTRHSNFLLRIRRDRPILFFLIWVCVGLFFAAGTLLFMDLMQRVAQGKP
jgi:hypothetical protein